MDELDKQLIKYVTIALAVIFILGFSLALMEASFASKHYNKLTGANTTMWDAMWLDLRVVEPTKKNE